MLLPVGVLLRKSIVALVIELNIRLCKVVDASVHTDTNKVDWTIAAIIIKNVNPAKMIIHDFLDSLNDVNNSSGKTVADVLFDFEEFTFRKTFSSKLILNKPHIFIKDLFIECLKLLPISYPVICT